MLRQGDPRRLPLPSPQQIAALRFAAAQMTGAQRRACQAEMTLPYCAGSARQAERVFGWGRETSEGGLAERGTGVTCVGAQSTVRGRKRWEEQHPQAAAALGHLAAAQAQQDPTFRPPLASTRLTAKAAGAARRDQGYKEKQVPAPSTMATVLNRLGFRLRKVRKAKPQKKMAQPDASFDNRKKTTRTRRRQATSTA